MQHGISSAPSPLTPRVQSLSMISQSGLSVMLAPSQLSSSLSLRHGRILLLQRPLVPKRKRCDHHQCRRCLRYGLSYLSFPHCPSVIACLLRHRSIPDLGSTIIPDPSLDRLGVTFNFNRPIFLVGAPPSDGTTYLRNLHHDSRIQHASGGVVADRSKSVQFQLATLEEITPSGTVVQRAALLDYGDASFSLTAA